jgi:hypothetical protein
MIVEWFSPARPTLEWFGQTSGTLDAIQRQGISAVASVIGPPGSSGAGAQVGPGFKIVGAEIRYDFSSLTGG